MINGFLNVSRLESGKMQIDLERFDLSQLVREIEEETTAAVSSHPITFGPVPQIFVNADKEKIGQVFTNLLNNAVKYSQAGSPINVSCNVQGNHLLVKVQDSGMGIGKEDLPLLFDRYYRVKEAELNHIAGFGIGLYLCSEIIKRHAGSIWAESTPGEGSTFCFTLPIIA
jgi:signal transduction histidine kinase